MGDAVKIEDADVQCSLCKMYIPTEDSNMLPSQMIICDECMQHEGLVICNVCFRIVPQVEVQYYTHDALDPSCLTCGEKSIETLLKRARNVRENFLRQNLDVKRLLTPPAGG